MQIHANLMLIYANFMQIRPLPGDFSNTDLEDVAGGKGEAPPYDVVAPPMVMS